MPARAELFLSIRFPRVHTLAVNAGGYRKACLPSPADATLERKRKEKQRVSGRSHSRATHAAGRDFPKTQNALSPRSVLFFWTVHCAAVGGSAAYGCGIPLAGAARFLFGKIEKKMGGASLPAKPAFPAPKQRAL